MTHISRNGWVGLVVAAVLVGGGIALFLGGYVPQIGRFFAAEPGGYVPVCSGYGQPLTYGTQCCSGLVPVGVTHSPLPPPSPAVTVPPLGGALVLQLQDPGSLYCTPGGVGYDRTPTFSWSGPDLPSSNTPVEILQFKPLTGTFEVIRVMNTQNYYSFTKDDLPLPRPLAYQVRLVSDRSIVSNVLELPVDCSVAQQNPYPNYCVVQGCTAVQRSVTCVTSPCPRPTVEIVCPPGVTPPPTITPYPTRTSLPSPYPTSVPIEMYLERSNDSPAGVTEPAFPGEVKSVRVMIHAAQSISAAKIILTYDRRFEFLSFDGVDLPEVLMKPVERPFQNEFGTWGQMEVSVGSGPTPVGGYVIAGIAQFRVKEDTTIGTNLSIDPDSMSEVAAVGRPGNSLSLVRGSLGYAVALLPTGGPGQPGDADGDGDVDIFDYNIVVSEFGRTNDFGYDRGDLDKNGIVDIFDYNLVVSNFGRGVQ